MPLNSHYFFLVFFLSAYSFKQNPRSFIFSNNKSEVYVSSHFVFPVIFCFCVRVTLPIFQIHLLNGGKVQIYSRNSEDNTTKYPDIISRMPKVIREETKSAVIDSEAVAFDVEKKQILPFQILSTRKRKVITFYY